MNNLFKMVDRPEHNSNDNDCMCPGCIQVLANLAEEMAEPIKKEKQ